MQVSLPSVSLQAVWACVFAFFLSYSQKLSYISLWNVKTRRVDVKGDTKTSVHYVDCLVGD